MEKILAVADSDKDGKINFQEFVSVSNPIFSWLLTFFALSRILVMSLLSLVKSGCRDQKKALLYNDDDDGNNNSVHK